jgi:5-methylcytosine-specific restriction protein A
MARVRISSRKRAALFERDHGLCHLCGLRVDAGQAWDVSHEIPLACGGVDDETNWRVAHRRCHRRHTATVDAKWIAKTRHQRDGHTGAKVRKGPPIPSRGFAKSKRERKRTTKIAAGPTALARRMQP